MDVQKWEEDLREQRKRQIRFEKKLNCYPDDISEVASNLEYLIEKYYDSYSQPDEIYFKGIEERAKDKNVPIPHDYSHFKYVVCEQFVKAQIHSIRELVSKKEDWGFLGYHLNHLKESASEGGVKLPNALGILEKALTDKDFENSKKILDALFPEVSSIYDIVRNALLLSPDAEILKRDGEDFVLQKYEGDDCQLVYVAPKKNIFDLNELQEFTESLIPRGIEPYRKRDFGMTSKQLLLGAYAFSNVSEGRNIDVRIYPSKAFWKDVVVSRRIWRHKLIDGMTIPLDKLDGYKDKFI